MCLVPQVVELCKGHKNFFGTDVLVVAAGGIYDGRGLAASLSMGAAGIWCGTAFLATPEANCEDGYKQELLKAKSSDTIRTRIYTGRPMRVARNKAVNEWEGPRRQEMEELLSSGVIPMSIPSEQKKKNIFSTPAGTSAKPIDRTTLNEHFDRDTFNLMMGQAVGAISKIRPAEEIVVDMVQGAVRAFKENAAMMLQSNL